jgi:hypothetical protein
VILVCVRGRSLDRKGYCHGSPFSILPAIAQRHAVPRMPLFLLCLFCFLIAISIISPATETSAIHRHLEAHFGLDQVQSIADVEGIYSFIKSFEEKNRELMPTSPNYWCEHRYFQYQWDDHYMVPRTSCSSHRFTALGLQSAPFWTNETSAGSSGVGWCDGKKISNVGQLNREREMCVHFLNTTFPS